MRNDEVEAQSRPCPVKGKAMDIGSILAAADAEVAYDKDDFEPVEHENNRSTVKQQHAETPVRNTSSVLQSAAQVVSQEERRQVREVMKSSAIDTLDEANERFHTPNKTHHDRERERERSPPSSRRESLRQEDLLATPEVKNTHTYRQETPRTATKTHDSKPVAAREEEKDSEEEEEEISESEGEAANDSDDEDEIQDDDASRALLFAIHEGRAEGVQRALRKEGTSLKYRDRHGWTAMHWAASQGNTEIIEMVLDFWVHDQKKKTGLVLNAQDTLTGWTPLHVAAVCGHREAVKLLIEKGAKKKKKSFMNEYPFDVIGVSKNTKAIKMLLNVKRKKKSTAESKEETKNSSRY